MHSGAGIRTQVSVSPEMALPPGSEPFSPTVSQVTQFFISEPVSFICTAEEVGIFRVSRHAEQLVQCCRHSMALRLLTKKQDQLCLWAPMAPTFVQGNRLSAVVTGYHGGHFWASAGNCGVGGLLTARPHSSTGRLYFWVSQLQIRDQTTCLLVRLKWK